MPEKSVKERVKEARRDGVEPETFLIEEDVIETVDDETALRFTEDFESVLKRFVTEYDETGVDSADLARIFDVYEDEDVEDRSDSYPSYKIINTVHKWPSESALIVDAALDDALREYSPNWTDVPPRQRFRIIKALRGFQSTCFFCGGEIQMSDETTKSCCSERQVLTLHCDGCERRFLEFRTETLDPHATARPASGPPRT